MGRLLSTPELGAPRFDRRSSRLVPTVTDTQADFELVQRTTRSSNDDSAFCCHRFDDHLLCNSTATMGGVAMPALRGKICRTKVQCGDFDDRAVSLAAGGRLGLQPLRTTLWTKAD